MLLSHTSREEGLKRCLEEGTGILKSTSGWTSVLAEGTTSSEEPWNAPE